MKARWIAGRVLLEILRDRRTFFAFLAVPVLVMTLVYYAIAEDEIAQVAVVTRGVARLFEPDLMDALEEEGEVEVVELDIDDEEADDEVLRAQILAHLVSGAADGVIYMSGELLTDRFNGERGTLHLYVEGSRPTLTASVLSGVAGAMDNLTNALPTVIDASCDDLCADSVNTQPMDLEKHYLYGSADYRLIDFFLPVLPPLFVFFFTFIISVITFQRERVRGTLERLMMAPVSMIDIVVGFTGGFLLFASLQSAIVLGFFLAMFGFPLTLSQIVALVAVMFLLILVSLMLGLLASFLAQNEFQAIQFVPVVLLPQIFLADIIWSLDSFPWALRVVSYALPLTHANVAVRNIMLKEMPLWSAWPQLLALVAFLVGCLALLAFVARNPRNVL